MSDVAIARPHPEPRSVIGLGGYNLGDAPSLKKAIAIMYEVIDAGVNLCENAREMNRIKLFRADVPERAIDFDLHGLVEVVTNSLDLAGRERQMVT